MVSASGMRNKIRMKDLNIPRVRKEYALYVRIDDEQRSELLELCERWHVGHAEAARRALREALAWEREQSK